MKGRGRAQAFKANRDESPPPSIGLATTFWSRRATVAIVAQRNQPCAACQRRVNSSSPLERRPGAGALERRPEWIA